MEEKTIKSNELIDVLRSMNNNELFNFFLYSCENGHLDLCQLCLDVGADINIRECYYGHTLLYILVSNGKFTATVADWLIGKGADINAGSNTGWTPLTMACYRGNFAIAKYFIDKGSTIRQYKDAKDVSTDLYLAVSGDFDNPRGGNHLEIVKLLLEKGVDLDADIQHHMNPFIYAIEKKKTNIVELFLQRGLSPNYYHQGITPLHIAVANKDTKTARLLLDYNANVNANLQDSYTIKKYLSITPMDIAVFKHDTKMQQLLLEFGGTTSSKEERINALLECCDDNEVSSKIKKVLAS